MSIQAMKQALEALESPFDTVVLDETTVSTKAKEAIPVLRAAIEAAEKCEPVAWILSHPDGSYLCWGKPENYGGTPLYTHPQPVVPEKKEPSEFDLSGDNDFNRGWNACRKAMLVAAPECKS